MQLALLWYITYKRYLKRLGFKLNKYDLCIANKIKDEKECTVDWYVDDAKISHVKTKVVDWVVKQWNDKFDTLTKKRGNKHTFVGMDIEITKNKWVKVLIKEYFEENVKDFGEKLSKTANTSAKRNLFEIGKDSQSLFKDKAELFYLIVSKLLWVAKIGRIYIEHSISFLYTRVSCSLEEDW